MKIDTASDALRPCLPSGSISPGIYPYVGGSITVDQLKSVVGEYGGAVVSGLQGVKLAAKVPGVLVDPAQYGPQDEADSETLFDFDEWLIRQQAANVPVILTDTPRIRNGDRSALREGLRRWEAIADPTMVVLPIEPWWLKAGRATLTEEVRAAGRPVAIVLLHHYNGLDPTDAVAGLLAFMSAIWPLPLVLLRSDISAVGAVAQGASAGFVGWSSSSRHGPLPIRPPADREDHDKDESPNVFVPILHDYFKASRFPAFAGARRLDLLQCDSRCYCRGSLLRIAELSDSNPRAARTIAAQHNMASTELVARRVFAAAEPRDAWWEACKAGADAAASLAGNGIILPESRWLRQWLDVGSPSHMSEAVG